jgi:nucleoside-diphosphate-sugar epimerase
MLIFLTGAAGYIGGSVAAKLMAAGHRVRGLVRAQDKAEQLNKLGIEPVIGTLDDGELLRTEARQADGVIDTASADHLASVEAFISALEGTAKTFIHTSGSSVIGDDARGQHASDVTFDEESTFVIEPSKRPRRVVDLLVVGAADRGVRSAVICPSNIYGAGRGIGLRSVQIPLLVDNALQTGVVQIVGNGTNRWSNVHIDDLTDLYLLVLAKAPPGAFYFAENGEASFADIGAAISARLGLGAVQNLSAADAAHKWGEGRAFYSLGSNSRVRAKRARTELGWVPRHDSVIDWITTEMPV